MKKLKNMLKQAKAVISSAVKENFEDALIWTGFFFIALATFKLNVIAGLYVIGGLSSGLGFYLIRNPSGGR